MGDARDGPLQQLLLAKHLGGLGGDARSGVDQSSDCRLARAAEGDQEPQAFAGERQDEHGDGKADDEPDQLMGIHMRRVSTVGHTSASIAEHVTSLSAVADVDNDPRKDGTHGHITPNAG